MSESDGGIKVIQYIRFNIVRYSHSTFLKESAKFIAENTRSGVLKPVNPHPSEFINNKDNTSYLLSIICLIN